MPRLLKYGLIASGGGVALFVTAFVSGGVGICTSTTPGIIAATAGMCLVPAGVLLCVAAGVVAIVKRKPKPIAP